MMVRKDRVIAVFSFIFSWSVAFDVKMTYLNAVPRLNNSDYWDYYFSCSSVGATQQWYINGEGLGGFDGLRVTQVLQTTLKYDFNYSAILLSSSQARENLYLFNSLIIVSKRSDLILNVTCVANTIDNETISTEVGSTNVVNRYRSDNKTIYLEYLLTTKILSTYRYNFTSIFICGVDSDSMYWQTNTNNFTFSSGDSLTVTQNDLQPGDTSVKQLSLLLTGELYRIVTVLFATDITEIRVRCGNNEEQLELTSTLTDTLATVTTTTKIATFVSTTNTPKESKPTDVSTMKAHSTTNPTQPSIDGLPQSILTLIYSLIGVVVFIVLTLIAVIGMIAFIVNKIFKNPQGYSPTKTMDSKPPSDSSIGVPQTIDTKTSCASSMTNADQTLLPQTTSDVTLYMT